MPTLTMGIDLAAQPAKTAVCLLRWDEGGPAVVSLRRGRAEDGAALDDEWLVAAATDQSDRHGGEISKVGIDDPFGWPLDFLDAMEAYRHGPQWPSAPGEPRARFRYRATDRFVREQADKVPLSVSTDLIAIPAMRCATLLTEIGRRRGAAAVARDGSGLCCEVYPDPALRHWTRDASPWSQGRSYKGPTNSERRVTLLAALTAALAIDDPGGELEQAAAEDDYLDALLCALVARAVELGQTLPPQTDRQAELALVEGWIHLPCEPLGRLATG